MPCAGHSAAQNTAKGAPLHGMDTPRIKSRHGQRCRVFGAWCRPEHGYRCPASRHGHAPHQKPSRPAMPFLRGMVPPRTRLQVPRLTAQTRPASKAVTASVAVRAGHSVTQHTADTAPPHGTDTPRIKSRHGERCRECRAAHATHLKPTV